MAKFLLKLVNSKSDEFGLAKMRSGEPAAFEQVVRTHNQRLFRIARSILRDGFEAEDVVQEAYIKAFSNLDTFETAREPGAWLARITTNLAISRLRTRGRNIRLSNELREADANHNVTQFKQAGNGEMSPERQTALIQVRELLEREIDALPDGFREVFVLRIVEDMSVAETADALDLSTQTVKSRLSRARGKIQNSIKSQLTSASLKVFPFAGEHCDRITANVLRRLQQSGTITRETRRP